MLGNVSQNYIWTKLYDESTFEIQISILYLKLGQTLTYSKGTQREKNIGGVVYMAIEYEVRILEVPINKTLSCLERLGAFKVGAYHQKRYVYDYNPVQKGRWIRLRSNGKQATLTLKEIKSLQIDGTQELEIVVSDFDETNRILNKLGYLPRTFQENFRIEYRIDNITFDIDKWPGIPAYLEIEGDSKQSVLKALEMLNYSTDSYTTKDVDTIYNDVYGIVLDNIQHLQFSDDEMIVVNEYSKQ